MPDLSPTKNLWERLYADWREKIAVLQVESDKHDFSVAGEHAFQIALAKARQSYLILHDVDAQRVDALLKGMDNAS